MAKKKNLECTYIIKTWKGKKKDLKGCKRRRLNQIIKIVGVGEKMVDF